MPACTGPADAQPELFIVETATGAMKHWHWEKFTTPDPSLCKSISWAADGSWLLAEILRPPDWERLSSEGDDIAGTYHDPNWEISYEDVITGCVIRLDNENPRLRILLDAFSARIVHVWQAFEPPKGSELVPCKAGFYDLYRHCRMYIGPEKALHQEHGLREDQCEYMPTTPGSHLQVLLGPAHVSGNAVLSPHATVLVDLSTGPYATTLFHLCLSTQQMHAVLIDHRLTRNGLQSLTWLPSSPKRLVYALPLADASIILVDASKHAVLQKWSPVAVVCTDLSDLCRPMYIPIDPDIHEDSQLQVWWLPDGCRLVLRFTGTRDVTFVTSFSFE